MIDKDPRLLFSVTRKDFVVETFRGSGAGGQNRNKRETGVRITHPASGAVGQSCDQRSQDQNKQTALKRLRDSDTFMLWVKKEVARLSQDEADIERKVDRAMASNNLKVEMGGGPWVPYQEEGNEGK